MLETLATFHEAMLTLNVGLFWNAVALQYTRDVPSSVLSSRLSEQSHHYSSLAIISSALDTSVHSVHTVGIFLLAPVSVLAPHPSVPLSSIRTRNAIIGTLLNASVRVPYQYQHRNHNDRTLTIIDTVTT